MPRGQIYRQNHGNILSHEEFKPSGPLPPINKSNIENGGMVAAAIPIQPKISGNQSSFDTTNNNFYNKNQPDHVNGPNSYGQMNTSNGATSGSYANPLTSENLMIHKLQDKFEDQIGFLVKQVEDQGEALKSFEKWLEQVSLLARRDDQILRNDVETSLANQLASVKDQFLSAVLKQNETHVQQISEQHRLAMELLQKQVHEQASQIRALEGYERQSQEDRERDLRRLTDDISSLKSEMQRSQEAAQTGARLSRTEMMSDLGQQVARQTQLEVSSNLRAWQTQQESELLARIVSKNQDSLNSASSRIQADLTAYLTKQLPNLVEQKLHQVLAQSGSAPQQIQDLRKRQEEQSQELIQALAALQQVIDTIRRDQSRKQEFMAAAMTDLKKEMSSSCAAMVHELRREMYKLQNANISTSLSPSLQSRNNDQQ